VQGKSLIVGCKNLQLKAVPIFIFGVSYIEPRQDIHGFEPYRESYPAIMHTIINTHARVNVYVCVLDLSSTDSQGMREE
jgi:hypothetical protein